MSTHHGIMTSLSYHNEFTNYEFEFTGKERGRYTDNTGRIGHKCDG